MPMLSPPFVLLDDARPGGRARLYRQPVQVLTARSPAAVLTLLDGVRRGVGAGLHAAGMLAYEAAAAFDDALPPVEGELGWFGLFETAEPVDLDALLPDAAGAYVGAPRPLVDRAAYEARFAAVQALIAAGDLYQANLTFAATVPVAGDPLALYAAIRPRAAAGWGAVVATGAQTILSFSPELFFAVEDRAVTARPMKGTARRCADPREDIAAATALAADPKQRAENLMIVDLLRNDLSRVARPGSVAVPELFAVERFPTVHQMTSTVTATLAPDHGAVDLLAAAFPCGSITGAPKLRAIAALAEIESTPRGVYTGTIGAIAPDGSAQFNVAIRTLTLAAEEPATIGPATIGPATIGLGGGIVADSRVEQEWDEALAKGAFLTVNAPRIDLIETMAFDPLAGIVLLERHLERLGHSAATLGFRFDRHAARNELQAATFRLRTARRVRLLLSQGGTVVVEVSPMPPAQTRLDVAVVPLPVDPGDFRLRHKTADRSFYTAARHAAGTSEVVFQDRDGFLTEGSFTTLFVPVGDRLYTPPFARGLLPGVLRAELIAAGRAVEADLTPGDLAGGFLLGNALRGLIPAFVADAKEAAIAASPSRKT